MAIRWYLMQREPDAVSREWAVLDTFDMYAPAHDHPQSVDTVRKWFFEIGFVDIDARRGPNGVIGRGRRPAAGSALS